MFDITDVKVALVIVKGNFWDHLINWLLRAVSATIAYVAILGQSNTVLGIALIFGFLSFFRIKISFNEADY